MSTTPTAPVENTTPAAPDNSAPATPPAGASAPTTPPSTPVATPASSPAAAEPAAPPAGDFSDLLAEDLKPITPEAAPAAEDLATKYANDPTVQALLTEKAQYAPVAEIMKSNRYEIPSPEELKLQLEDSNALYDIMNGKAPASKLLETMLNNPSWNQEAKNAVIADIAKFISTKTGTPIAAAAAGQIEDPAMAEIKKIRAEQAAEKAQKEQEAFTGRVNAAKTTLTGKVNEMLAGTWLEGEGDYVMALLGQKFSGPEKAMEVVAAVERGDFTQVQKALQAIKNEEATRYVARNKRMLELAKKKGATIPAQVAAGAPPAPATEPGTNIVELDADKRRAAMLAAFRNQ